MIASDSLSTSSRPSHVLLVPASAESISARVTLSVVVRYWATGTIGTSASGESTGGGLADGSVPAEPDGIGATEPPVGDGVAGSPDAAATRLGAGVRPDDVIAPHAPLRMPATSRSTATAMTGTRFTGPMMPWRVLGQTGCEPARRGQKDAPSGRADGAWVHSMMADPTGFEPAISSVTGWHVGPLHHGSSCGEVGG